MKKLLTGLLFALWFAVPAHAQNTPGQLPTINQSVTIVTGNTFQTVVATSGRRSLTISNNNASDSCWISFGSFGGVTITAANATKPRSILLIAGGSYTRYFPYTPNDEIEGTCASNGDTLYVDIQ